MIKVTINRSCREVGGLLGNTQNPCATENWTKIYYIVALHEHLHKKINKKTKERHFRFGTDRMGRDEEDI